VDRVDAEEVDPQVVGREPDVAEPLLQDAPGQPRAVERRGRRKNMSSPTNPLQAVQTQLGVRGQPPIDANGPIPRRCASS
jgi:hypothetical protein